MMKISDLILESNYQGVTISDILQSIDELKNNTLIFFDTETLGLKPENKIQQLTQIGIICIDGATMKETKTLNMKIQINDDVKPYLDKNNPEIQKLKQKDPKYKSPSELLDMTGYFNDLPETLATEERALNILKKLIEVSKNPILIAHNAQFDVRFINVRGKLYNITFPKTKVIDTRKLVLFYLLPVLKKLNKHDILKKLRKYKVMAIKDIKPKGPNHHSNHDDPNHADFEQFTDDKGNEMLKIFFGEPSSSLGKLTPALIGEIENWHDALADVKSMILLFQKIIEVLQPNRNLDIAELQAIAYKHYMKQQKRK